MPITTGNFQKLVEQGFYNGVIFHRIIDGFRDGLVVFEIFLETRIHRCKLFERTELCELGHKFSIIGQIQGVLILKLCQEQFEKIVFTERYGL